MKFNSAKYSQKGATLIVCMIILVIITILGVGSIQDTTLEEKMAGNMKNRNMAFQAAETALRHAEEYLSETTILPGFDGTTTGLYAQIDTDSAKPITWSASKWLSDGVKYEAPSGHSDEIGGVAIAPYYVIEKLDSTIAGVELEASEAEDNDEFYRITARAVGGTDTAVVILQSIYRR